MSGMGEKRQKRGRVRESKECKREKEILLSRS